VFLIADRDKANETIGERIHLLMWRQSKTQDQLADLLAVPRSSVSNRLRGKIKWSAVEVSIAAAWLDVKVTDLIPAVLLDQPVAAGGLPEGSVLVLGVGRHSK
jgi:predicted XRE-type DNA-binding protein